MTPLQEFAFFFVAGLVALTALVFLIAFVTACRWYLQDVRHLRARAREAAPALDDAVREAVRLRVVESRPNVYVLADRRRDSGECA